MQPLFVDEDGRIRFRQNEIVQYLLDTAREGRRCNLNDLAVLEFSQKDWEQFFQLIGYSVTGYHELRRVSDVSALEATAEARKLKPDYRGCRDEGCGIHCGIEIEDE